MFKKFLRMVEKMFFKKKKKNRAIVIDANGPLYWAGKMHDEGFQNYLQKLNGVVFIPWIVHVELAVMYWNAKREKEIRESGDSEELKALEESLSQLDDETRRMREKRGPQALIAYPFVQEKIEREKWKLIGKDADIEPYLKGFNGVEEKMKGPDAKILATCLFLADKFNFREVILLTRDRDLRQRARKYGVQVEGGLSDLIKN